MRKKSKRKDQGKCVKQEFKEQKLKEKSQGKEIRAWGEKMKL